MGNNETLNTPSGHMVPKCRFKDVAAASSLCIDVNTTSLLRRLPAGKVLKKVAINSRVSGFYPIIKTTSVVIFFIVISRQVLYIILVTEGSSFSLFT